MLHLPGTGPTHDRTTINFEWLIMLRWAAVLGQLVTVLVVHFALEVELPLSAIFTVLATEVVTNALLIARLRGYRNANNGSDEQGSRRARWELEVLQTSVMVFDTMLVFVLLALSG